MPDNWGDNDYGDKTIIYDLRQIYAKDIVGVTLKNIQMARTTENYHLWYHLLKRDLMTEISQNLSDVELDSLRNQIKETKKVIDKHKGAYRKLNTKPEDHEAIEDALCDLEMAMTKLMKKHKMYGAKEQVENL